MTDGQYGRTDFSGESPGNDSGAVRKLALTARIRKD